LQFAGRERGTGEGDLDSISKRQDVWGSIFSHQDGEAEVKPNRVVANYG